MLSRFGAAAGVVCLCLAAAAAPAADKKADLAWEQVIAGGKQRARGEHEDYLAHFMSEVERIDRRRRDLGLKFWREFPNDPRRYEWLLMTVLMPPHYPVSIDQWARNETLTRYAGAQSVNSAPVDVNSVRKWSKAFPGLRAEYLRAKVTSATQRRILESFAIYQDMRAYREARARGEHPDPAPLLNAVLDLTQRYPEAVDELDASNDHVSDLHRLYLNLFERWPADYFVDSSALRAYLELLVRAGGSFTARYAGVLRKRMDEGGGSFVQMPDNWPRQEWSDIPYWAAENFGASFEGKIASMHLLTVQAMKHAWIGRRLWNEKPEHHQRYRWLLGAYEAAGYILYPRDFASCIRIRAADPRQPFDIDTDADREWTAFLAAGAGELSAEAVTTDAERSELQRVQLGSGFNRLVFQGAVAGEPEIAKALLEKSAQWYARFHDEQGFAWTLATLMRDYKSYSLDDTDIMRFAARFTGDGSQAVREGAQAIVHTLNLKTTPFELAAKTLDGTPFDIKTLRGKIVFLDHWTTTCSGCLAAMPAFHSIFLDYKDRGVEVISVGYDAAAKAKRVQRIVEQKGLTWTTVAADDLLPVMQQRYGWSGFPQYSLLNRNGTLRAGTADIGKPQDLRALLDAMLSEEASTAGDALPGK